MESHMDKASSSSLMVLYMMAAGKMGTGMAQGPIPIRMETNTRESGRETSHPSQVQI